MKDIIVDFINNLKTTFENRRSKMPPARFHKPHIQSLAADELALESAVHLLVKLDDTKIRFFAENTLYHLMENVLPIFENWKMRIKAIAKGYQENSPAHIKAKADYKEYKKELRDIIAQLNCVEGKPLIFIEPKIESPGKAIMKQYQREKYVSDHKIQVTENVTIDEDTVCVSVKL